MQRKMITRMMNGRKAYHELEETIIKMYEQKTLSLDRLDRIVHQSCLIGIHSAGSQHLLTHDGKDLQQICIELIDPTFPIHRRGSSEDHEEAWERELKCWEEIIHKRWGFYTCSLFSPLKDEVPN